MYSLWKSLLYNREKKNETLKLFDTEIVILNGKSVTQWLAHCDSIPLMTAREWVKFPLFTLYFFSYSLSLKYIEKYFINNSQTLGL